jgi:hypothetical protein
MQRQGIIYAVFGLVAAGMLAYLLVLCGSAWAHFGWSLAFGLLVATALVFALLCALFTYLAFVFRVRAVSAISSAVGGVMLTPEGQSFAGPVVVPSTRIVRVIGAQFSRNEAAPAFTLFAAAGKLWVTSTHVLAPASQGHAQ